MQSKTTTTKGISAIRFATSISLCYPLAGMVWILLSDHSLVRVMDDAARMGRAQTLKGSGFVLVTSVLLWLLTFSRARASRVMSPRAALMPFTIIHY